MIRAAKAELESLASRGEKAAHKDFEMLYRGTMVMIACVCLGDQEATSRANLVKDSSGRWKVAESRECEGNPTRRHLVFEFVVRR